MTVTGVHRLVLFGAGLTLTGLGGLANAEPAAAATCRSGVSGDVNGDGYGEAAVSSAGRSAHRGGVHVFYGQQGRLVTDATGTALDDQYLDQDTPGVPGTSAANDQFGKTTAFGDFNHDGCADLAIGAPNDGRSGSVTVLFGSPRGLKTSGVQVLLPDASVGSNAGSGFGRSLVAADLDGDRIDDLAVGVPRLSVGGAARAGAVVVLRGSTSGLQAGTTYTQNSPGIPETAGVDHLFGTALAAGDFDGNGVDELAVSVTGDTSAEGGVQVIRRDPPGGQQPALITARTLGVVDSNGEPITSFGTTLAAGDTDADGRDELAISAPDSVAPAPSQSGTSAGAVFVLRGSSAGLTGRGLQTWTQENVGVPDPEVDPHRFGAQLVFGHFDAGPTADLAIGEPQDEVPSIAAGSVTVLFGGPAGLTATGSRNLHEGVPGVAGTLEDGDLFGGAVGSVVLRRDGQQGLIVGSPGEDLDGKRDVGRIHQFALGPNGPEAKGSRVLYPGTAGVKGAVHNGGSFGLAVNGTVPPLYPLDQDE